MKKNVMFRIASALMVTALMTTCIISGTFAKYVTSVSANDYARVAKFGVVITGNGTAFAKEYATDDAAVVGTIANSVLSSEDVLAPGTSGTLAQSTITGTPEVAVNVKREAELTYTEAWCLNDGSTYYCPLTFTVNGTDYYGMDYENHVVFFEAVEAAISAESKNYPAGTDLSGITADTLDVSWSWAYEVEGAGSALKDENDTIMGNLTGSMPNVSLTVTTTVTQID